MSCITKSLVFTLAMVAALPLSAQRLSRADAVALALRRNPEVLRSREQIKLYEGRITEEKAAALPDLSASSVSLRFADPAFLNSASFDAFPEELRTGLRPVAANLFETGLELRQTLYSFKVGKAIRAARLARTLGEQDLRRAQQRTALDTVQAYNAVVYAREQLRVAEDNVAQKEKHLTMARNRRAAGVATELEVLRTEVDLENQRAQLARARGQVDLARSALNAIMLRGIDEPIDPSDQLDLLPFEFSLSQVMQAALQSRPEIKSAALTEDIRGELVGIAQADSRPSVEFVGGYGMSTRKWDNFFDRDFSKWNASINIKVPIFDGKRTAGRVQQARAEQGKATQDRIALENQIRLESTEAYTRLNVASQVVTAARLNVQQARKALEMTQANYNYGAAMQLDVTDAQNALLQAQSILNQGLHDYANARAALLFIMGRDPLE